MKKSVFFFQDPVPKRKRLTPAQEMDIRGKLENCGLTSDEISQVMEGIHNSPSGASAAEVVTGALSGIDIQDAVKQQAVAEIEPILKSNEEPAKVETPVTDTTEPDKQDKEAKKPAPAPKKPATEKPKPEKKEPDPPWMTPPKPGRSRRSDKSDRSE